MNTNYDSSEGYNAFRQAYELQHPASIPVLEYDVHEYQSWVRYAVLVTFVCAAAVSGIHTVPTVWQSIETNAIVTETMRTVVSYASLAAIELAILLSAYLMAKGVKLAYAVMAVASAVAVLANLYSVFKAFNSGSDGFALIVSIALGIGAPLIALFSGKMFVDIHRADRIQDARAKKTYKDTCIAWDKEIASAYKNYLKEVEKKNRVGDATDKQNLSVYYTQTADRQQTDPYNRVGDATDKATQYLQANPQSLDMTLRELADMIGVGKDSVAKAKRLIQASQNGHAE